MALSNFLKGLQNMWVGTEDAYYDLVIPGTISGSNVPFDISRAESVSSVYTSIKILAETVSRMPLNIYSDEGEGRTVNKDDYRYALLHYNPNAWTTQQQFFSALEYWRNLKGNSFARIFRNGRGEVTSLVLIPPSKVLSYAISNGELYYTIKDDNNKEIVINASEILHFRGLTKDGIWGINPIEALRMNLSASYQGIQTIDNFYKNNAASPKAIKSTISGANQKALIEALNEFERKYAGSQNAGKLIPLPPNTEIVDMALNMADAEFIATLKFNTTQIGSLYGIPPHMLGILEATKFNNVEMMMLDFKATTLASISRMYRQELEFKLLTTNERLNGISIEFNFNSLVEVNQTERFNNYRTLANLGVITANDIAKLEGWPTYPEGDYHLVPGNYLTMDQVISKATTPPAQQ